MEMEISPPAIEIIKEYDTGSGQVLVKNLKWKSHE